MYDAVSCSLHKNLGNRNRLFQGMNWPKITFGLITWWNNCKRTIMVKRKHIYHVLLEIFSSYVSYTVMICKYPGANRRDKPPILLFSIRVIIVHIKVHWFFLENINFISKDIYNKWSIFMKRKYIQQIT